MAVLLTLLGAACPADNAPLSAPTAPIDPAPVEQVVGQGTPPTHNIEAETPLFDLSVVHAVALELPDATVAALSSGSFEWVPGELTIDGAAVGTVGLRLKGVSSLRYYPDKCALKLRIDQYTPSRYDGYDSFDLNNMLWDESQMHERVGWQVLRQLDPTALQSSYAELFLNGESFGLYALVETYDARWLADEGAPEDARIYEGGYDAEGEHADFLPSEVRHFELEEGEPVGHTDLIVLSDANAGGADAWATRVAPYLDLDTFAAYYVREAWIGHWDGYVTGANNFRVLSSSAEGPIRLLPSGLDWAFTEGRRWDSPLGALAVSCVRDLDCVAALDAAAVALVAELDTDALLSDFDEAAALIGPWIEADTRREIRDETWPLAQADLRLWLAGRSGQLRDELGL